MAESNLQTNPPPDTGAAPQPASRTRRLWAIFKREFLSYFRSPVAYVFLAVFILAGNGLTWFIGNWFESNDASLTRFFEFLPWVYLFLIPAVGMRLWSEEKRSGTWELLFTYPLSVAETVVGKFLAGWAFVGVGLLLTFTMPFTAAFLGNPDWGPIFAGYLGAFLLAGAYLGISSLASAVTRNQVISFVIGVIGCLIMVFLGWSVFNDLLQSLGFSVAWVDFVANLGFLPHFDPMSKGLIAIRDLLYFFSVILFTLWLNIVILER